jgi:ribosomal-protein-alanine N-acetyltransferase
MSMADAHDIFDYSRDPMVSEHVLWDTHRNVADSKAYLRYILRQYRNNEASSWGIELKRTGRLIGTIGFMWWNQQFRSAEVGYSLSRAYWNYGLMTEALQAVIRFGFEEMHLYRVEAQHEIDNPASGRVMEKAGMRKEGVLRGRIYNKGRHVDVCLYAILRGDSRR